jgi:hypothetical protein
MRGALGLVAVLVLLQVMPAQAQLPCGLPVGRPCPAPTPVPTVTPEPTTPVQITLRAKPRSLTWFDVAELSGRVTGPPELDAALADGTVELELHGRAAGYDRDLEPIPVFPDARGRFTATDVTGVNTRFQVIARGDFSGVSRALLVRWRPALEVQATPVGRRLRIAFKATGPARIPTRGGDTRTAPGTARRAFFYAGPGRRVPRIGSRPLRARNRLGARELRATLSVLFSRLPPGGGAAFACFEGTAFRGMQRSFKRCGDRTAPLP